MMTTLSGVATETIDRRAHLTQLGIQAFAGAAAYITGSWLPLALAGGLFAWSALLWPRYAPVFVVFDRFVAPRLGTTPWSDDLRPARISTAIAGVTLLSAAGAVGAGYGALVLPVMTLLAGVLVAEIVIGACFPCEMVVWAIRRGWLRPETS
jgi:hypothetical protein